MLNKLKNLGKCQLMKEHNVQTIFETLAKIFEERENCKISVNIVKQNENQKHIHNSQI